jgi:hypothetical protein
MSVWASFGAVLDVTRADPPDTIDSDSSEFHDHPMCPPVIQ